MHTQVTICEEAQRVMEHGVRESVRVRAQCG